MDNDYIVDANTREGSRFMTEQNEYIEEWEGEQQ